jgi:hypothetical protein
MKQLIITGFAIALSVFAIAEPPLEVTRGKRGLFGYREVTETTAEGRHTLSCFNPGWSNCKAMGMVTLDETTTLSTDELASIDATVDSFISESNTSGKFVYANKAVVIYSYTTDTDTISYQVYSVAQARTLHLI